MLFSLQALDLHINAILLRIVPPCITCGSTVGVCSTVGVFSTVGEYLEYCRDVQCRGGYHDKCGDISSTVGVFSSLGDIMSTVGCSVPWGTQTAKTFPLQYWTPPQYSWYPHVHHDISPMVLSIPAVLKITPTVLHARYTGWYHRRFTDTPPTHLPRLKAECHTTLRLRLDESNTIKIKRIMINLLNLQKTMNQAVEFSKLHWIRNCYVSLVLKPDWICNCLFWYSVIPRYAGICSWIVESWTALLQFRKSGFCEIFQKFQISKMASRNIEFCSTKVQTSQYNDKHIKVWPRFNDHLQPISCNLRFTSSAIALPPMFLGSWMRAFER